MTEPLRHEPGKPLARRGVLKSLGMGALGTLLFGFKAESTHTVHTNSAQASGAKALSNTRVYQVGDTKVEAVVYEKGTGLTYFNMHDNENTSAEAAKAFIDKVGGRLIELKHSGDRNLTFGIDGSKYEMDPNRMFTDAGVKLKLVPYDEKAGSAVRKFAKQLVVDFGLDSPKGGIMVAVHNNTNDRYSASSYLPGGSEAKEAADVYINPSVDPDDFFFVTGRKMFESLKQSGFNVVLQDNSAMTDDGSLSVYCAQKAVPYVNIEAQHGHKEVQIKMFEALHKIVKG